MLTLVIHKGGQWSPEKRKYLSRYKDKKGKWQYVYPQEADDHDGRKGGIYVAKILLPNGTWKYIRPHAHELNDKGELIGGRNAVREIVNRGIFGEWDFYPEDHKKAHQFWQHKGIMFEYRVRTTRTKDGVPIKVGDRGEVYVERVQRYPGFIDIEFRDKSVARAYDKELPQKIENLRLPPGAYEGTPRIPPKENRPAPEGTSDKPVGREKPMEFDAAGEPVIEHLDSIRAVPPMDKQTQVAIGEKLTEKEDPVEIAEKYLEVFLNAMNPSRAVTPAGQKKARDKRKSQFDLIVGKRRIKPLPLWAINKFDSREELQRELSRSEGKPLTTLITLGLWNKEIKEGKNRNREQLVREWHGELRYHARRAADSYKLTKEYVTNDSEGSRYNWIKERERDLYQGAVEELIRQANNYVSNDESHGTRSRFDKMARNAIMNHVYRTAEMQAREMGATGIVPEELADIEGAKQGPHYVISPQEHYELKHYGPIARKVLSEAISDMPAEHQAVWNSALWFDDPHTGTDESEEYQFNLARLRQAKKRGGAATKWQRPWVSEVFGTDKENPGAVPSVADKLGHIEVTQRSGEVKKLKELSPELQRYYLKSWFEATRQHVKQKLQTPSGQLTPEGALVERWLRLEAKLAHVNRRTIVERTEHPVIEMPLMPHVAGKVHADEISKRPDVKFFRTPGSNQELGHRLGILRQEMTDAGPVYHDRFEIHGSKHMSRTARQLQDADKHYKLVTAAAKIKDLKPALRDQKKRLEAAKRLGYWGTDRQGNAEWQEPYVQLKGERKYTHGVSALHQAAVDVQRAVKAKDEDAFKEANKEFVRVAQHVHKIMPAMVDEYSRALMNPELLTNEDLSPWKARAHALYRDQTNRMHVLEYEVERRNARKTLTGNDLMKAFGIYERELDKLFAMAA